MSNPVTVSLRASSNRPAQSMSSEERDQVDWSKLTNVPSITAGSGLTGGGPLTADVTLALQAGTIQNSSLASMATKTIKGNSTASTAAPTDLSVSTFSAMVEAINTDVDAGTATNSLITPRKLKRGYTNSPYYQRSGDSKTRAPRDKARDYCTSSDFSGMDPTGVSSSVSGFQSFVSEMSGGGQLRMMPGTYGIDSTVTLGDSLEIVAPHGGVTIKQIGRINGPIFQATSLTSCRIRGIAFDGNNLTSASATGSGGGAGVFTFTVSGVAGTIANGQRVFGTGIGTKALVTNVSGSTITVDVACTGSVSGTITFSTTTGLVNFTACSNVDFSNNRVVNFDIIGVATNATSTALIHNNYIARASAQTYLNQAILVGTSAGASSNVTISNNICYLSGIITQGSYLTIENNWCYGWKYGAGISTGTGSGDYYARVRGNYCTSGTGKDYDTYTLKGIENWSAYAVIEGNQCLGNSGPGIYNGGPYTAITGNVCVNNNTFGESDSGGIVIAYSDATNNGNYSVVTGNVCADSGPGTQTYGVVVSASCDYVTVSGNNLRGNVTAPYEVQGGTNTTVTFDGAAWTYSFTWNPTSISNGASLQSAQTVSGAALGDFLTVSCDIALSGLTLTAEVHATNTIYVTLTNNTGGAVDLASATFRVRGEKPLF